MLNPRIAQLKPSATLQINERCAELQRDGREVYRLGFGQSPFPVPPLVVEALRKHAPVKDYLPVQGLPELREAVASFNQRTLGLTYTAEQIMIGPGSKELIFLLQLLHEGEMLLPSPSWVSYVPQAQILGKKSRWIQTKEADGWCLQPAALEAACKAGESSQDAQGGQLLILNYPNNPAGSTYSASQMEELAAVARKYKLWVIADEIYGETHHKGEHLSFAQFYPEMTFVTSGLSKWCGAGGWRLGTMSFPNNQPALLNAMKAAASETFSAVSAPIQYAAVTAYTESSDLNLYITLIRNILTNAGNKVWQGLSEAKISMPAPAGGFYLFPNFANHRTQLAARGVSDSVSLCKLLLEETGVALLPGMVFGRPAEELSCRLAYVDFDGKAALQAFEKINSESELDGFFSNSCPRLNKAVELIANWV